MCTFIGSMNRSERKVRSWREVNYLTKRNKISKRNSSKINFFLIFIDYVLKLDKS